MIPDFVKKIPIAHFATFVCFNEMYMTLKALQKTISSLTPSF